MAEAYSRFLPDIEIVSVTGIGPWLRNDHIDYEQFFGLRNCPKVRRLPFMVGQKDALFGQEHKSPPWFFKIAAWYARLRRAALVFTRSPETALSAVNFGIACILEIHQPVDEIPGIQQRVSEFTNPKLLGIVVVTKPLVRSYLDAGVPANKILLEPDGVDLHAYNKPISSRSARLKLGMDPDSFTAVYTGHLYRDRGIESILKAARLLPDVNFYLVGGWDQDITHYKNEAKALPNVTIVGFVENSFVPIWQQAADVLIMSYSTRAMHASRASPLKLFEYLAAGRAIVCSNLPVLREVVKDKDDVYMVAPDDADELAKAINHLRDDSSLRLALSKRARTASFHFAWEDRAKRILETTGVLQFFS